jgi:hypothetical protein
MPKPKITDRTIVWTLTSLLIATTAALEIAGKPSDFLKTTSITFSGAALGVVDASRRGKKG